MSRCACPGGMGEDCRLEERGERSWGTRTGPESPRLEEERGAGSGAGGLALAPRRRPLWLSLLPAPQVLQHPVHFLLFAQSLKDRQQVQELRVIHVIKPRLHGNSIFRMENVGSRGVVHDDDVPELSPEPTKIFNIVPSVENAGFPEESRPKHTPLVQQVSHRVSILG